MAVNELIKANDKASCVSSIYCGDWMRLRGRHVSWQMASDTVSLMSLRNMSLLIVLMAVPMKFLALLAESKALVCTCPVPMVFLLLVGFGKLILDIECRSTVTFLAEHPLIPSRLRPSFS